MATLNAKRPFRVVKYLILITTCFFFNSIHAQVNLGSGLVAYFPFSGNANDVSGNNINGVPSNAVLTTDRDGVANSAYYFNGTNSSILLPFSNLYSFPPSGDFTISVWLQPDVNTQWAAQAVVVKSPPNPDFTQSQWNYGIYLIDYEAMTGWGNNHIIHGNSVLGSNECWHNITYTYSDAIWKLYVDGVLQGSDLTQTKFILQDGSSRIAFGKKGESSGDYYKGKMDDVRIYNRVLNAQEIDAVSQRTTTCLINSCDNWLLTPALHSKTTVGDIDVTGNTITVEAMFNRTQPLNSGTFYGSLVSKHTNTVDANYSLLPNGCEITTTGSGYQAIFQACPLTLNKTYHVAMVYNGTTLKFYRDGFLLSQVPCTGNIVNNNLLTTIGQIAGGADPVNNQFLGYINEVRIWKVARTQTEISNYMNTPLPNPATQPGLVAYYTFDNTANDQGNPAWNNVLISGAQVGQINPNCNFELDNCGERIVNDYTEVLDFDPCNNSLGVGNASAFHVGDTVLMIQMKGAAIDSTDSPVFGNVTDYKNSGNYEFNYVKAVNGNNIVLLNLLKRPYDIQGGKVQLVRVPYFQDYTTDKPVTCLPWDGGKGGVVVFNVQNNLQLDQGIDVSGKGFRGGAVLNSSIANCNAAGYFYDAASNNGGQKGEGIHNLSAAKNYGRGAPSVGGGGGNAHNCGGGGGGNAGAGGNGGDQWEGCGTLPENVGGKGGKALTDNAALNKIYAGGGGGMGHGNDNNEFPPGNGGGIVIISAGSITGNQFIKANGANATLCVSAGNCNDGMAGGGGGGFIVLNTNSATGIITLEAKGGKGADTYYTNINGYRTGPGGGGGGGFIAFSGAAALPAFITDVTGGLYGVNTNNANSPHGATAGSPGAIINSFAFVIDDQPFKKNIDSVKIEVTSASCSAYSFIGHGYTNTTPIVQWEFYTDEGSYGNSQFYGAGFGYPGDHSIKLVVTDANGCKDSTSMVLPGVLFDFKYQANICDPLAVEFTGMGTPNNPYWDFGDGNIITGVTAPMHPYAAGGNYLVRYSVTNGLCTDTLERTITIGPTREDIVLTRDTTICAGATKQLLTIPSTDFCWTPTTYLDDPNSTQPVTSTPQDITYYYTARMTGNNAIVNGDFSQGNTGFISPYAFAATNTSAGQYNIAANPQAWNPAMSACHDHTTGAGNMMMVNGTTGHNVNLWSQTVTVTPNTNYVFSTWMQSLSSDNLAQLRFSIGGIQVGSITTPPATTCTWSEFTTNWNSGSNTSVVIDIQDRNVLAPGNDFALDDISLIPVYIKRDSVKITVEKPVVKTIDDITVCKGGPIQLTTTGAQTYVWSPATGLSDPAIASPVASPLVPTEYHVVGMTASGCVGKDTVTIGLFPVPVITKSNDITICNNTTTQLFVSGGVSYVWTPAATLDNATINNPVASPVDTTMYYVTITDANNCKSKDSIHVSVRPVPVFAVNGGVSVCLKDSVALLASGGDTYLWQPAGGLNNSGIANPKASPDITTDYSVTITETTCHNSTVLSTHVTVLSLPDVTASKSNDLDCSVSESQLSASGGNRYVWTPAATLSNPNVFNPKATPRITTEYVVHGTDGSGCSNNDTIVVKVEKINEGGYFMPNAFTPNGDGKNDCFGMGYWGIIEQVEFSIFNRWGQRVFFTKDPYGCWDGKFQGVLQAPDVFVYMIKAKTVCEPSVFRKGTFVLIR